MTTREQQVACLTSQGIPQKQIADRLGISIKTVETYRMRLYRRHNLHNIADLTRWYIQERWQDETDTANISCL